MWTFAGQLVNAALGNALIDEAAKVRFDNLAVSFSGAADLDALKAAIHKKVQGAPGDLLVPLDEDFVDELKFGECLPQKLRDQELGQRYSVSRDAEKIIKFSMSKVRIVG